MPRITKNHSPPHVDHPASAPAAKAAPPPAARARIDGFSQPGATNPATVRGSTGTPLATPRITPAWLGNTAVVITREPSEHPVPSDTFTFDTWARQRAGTTKFDFEVWAPGTTDRENPDLWRDLDVEVHFRYGNQGPYQTDFVNFDGRAGNNARYAVELRKYDPWSQGGVSVLQPNPAVPITEVKSADGRVIAHQAKLNFFITVNGKELRPGSGRDFEGKFENY